MKSLKYFEQEAKRLMEEEFDFSLIKFDELVLSLMKKYRRENNIGWAEYKPVYDKYFLKYHG